METSQNQNSRRNFIGKLFAGSAFAAAIAVSPKSFADSFESPVLELASAKPNAKPKLMNSVEIGMGAPEKYLPHADVLKAALQSQPSGDAYPIQAWAKLVSMLRDADPMTQITMVNHFFNQVRYVAEQPGNDEWKMPARFLCEGGDCEDYAIAKFVTLRLLGFNRDRVRLVFLENTLNGAGHAVVNVVWNDKSLILDNMSERVIESARMDHYTPICSFTEKQLWMHWISGKSNNSVASLQQRFSKQS